MANVYTFIRTNVDITRLQVDIKRATNITKQLLYSTFEGPNVLKLYFNAALTIAETAALENVVISHVKGIIGEKKYLVKEYDPTGRYLVKETWYNKDNGDGTYSEIVEETLYVWELSKLMKRICNTYWVDGIVKDSEVWEYYASGKDRIIEKRGA